MPLTDSMLQGIQLKMHSTMSHTLNHIRRIFSPPAVMALYASSTPRLSPASPLQPFPNTRAKPSPAPGTCSPKPPSFRLHGMARSRSGTRSANAACSPCLHTAAPTPHNGARSWRVSSALSQAIRTSDSGTYEHRLAQATISNSRSRFTRRR